MIRVLTAAKFDPCRSTIRGPFVRGRIIDISTVRRARSRILQLGVAHVLIE